MSPIPGKVKLTSRELTTLTHIANGFTARETASKMFVAIDTVHDSLRRSRATLRARNTAHAVAIAMAAGLISWSAIKDRDDEWRNPS